MEIRTVSPKPLNWDRKYNFVQAVHVKNPTNILFISGQASLDDDGNVIHKGDIEAQLRKVYDNMKAVVEEAGGSMNNIVKTTAYVTDIRYFEKEAEVRKEYFRDNIAHTIAVINNLALEGMMCEIEAIAVIE